MALATPLHVRRMGGLDAVDDHSMFRLNTEAELDELVQQKIDVASAWLSSRAGAFYSDASLLTIFREAEGYLALHWLFPALKARKVMGTHWAVDSEESDRYAELIDVEWKQLAEELVDPYLTIAGPQNIALPAMVTTGVIDIDDVQTRQEELHDLIDEAIARPSIGTTPIRFP